MKNLIDVHVHMAAFPDGKNGCVMSPGYQKSLTARFVKWKMGLTDGTPEVMNRQYVARLTRDLSQSERVRQAVLLAFDGVYTDGGRLDENKTTCLVSNDYVRGVVEQNPQAFLFGASVNPQRRDALDELRRVIDQGTKLIKLLPNSHDIDLSQKKYIPFYRMLAERNIPLLSHVGSEHSFTPYHQDYGFPDRLERPLIEGVTVIGAHACNSAMFVHGRFFEVYVRFMKTYPNFFVDVSALTLPPSCGVVPLLHRHPEFFDRFLFGTDYPLSAWATPLAGRIGFSKLPGLWRMKNIFDKQAAVLEAAGLKFNVQLPYHLLRLKECV